MPLPLVVVEVPARDRAAPETPALIEACTAALGGGRCTLTQSRNLESVTAVAIVSWRDAEQLRALVEVARLHAPSEVWLSEELEFKSEDRRLERYRTLGLAIAGLFREAVPERVQSATGNPDPVLPARKHPAAARRAAANEPRGNGTSDEIPGDAGRNPPNATRAAASERAAEAWVSAGGLAFYDPKLWGFRVGSQLEFALGASGFPAFVSARGSYAQGSAPAGATLSWTTLGLGPGLRLALSPGVELRGVVRGLLVDVRGHASEAGRDSQASVWVSGAALGFELGLRASHRLNATLGAELQQLAAQVPIREHDRPVGSVGKSALGVTLTLELHLFGPSNIRR